MQFWAKFSTLFSTGFVFHNGDGYGKSKTIITVFWTIELYSPEILWRLDEQSQRNIYANMGGVGRL